MRTDPESLRKEAHSIASGGKNARQAWSELRQWAAGRGPLAMKSAMMEFLEAFGGTPEAAYVMPEIMRSASFMMSPQERVGIMHAALGRPRMDEVRSRASRIASVHAPPGALRRPEPAFSFRPAGGPAQQPALGRVEPLLPARDHAYLRDIPVRSRERLETALPSPREARKGAGARFDAAISPDSRAVRMHSGERLLSGLIGSLRSHGSYEAPRQAPARKAAPKRAGRKTPRKGRRAGSPRPRKSAPGKKQNLPKRRGAKGGRGPRKMPLQRAARRRAGRR